MTLTHVRRQRVHLDLPSLHAECETNYRRLLRLLPDLATEDRRRLALDTGSGRQRRFQLAVTERSRYTATLEMAELGPDPGWGLGAHFTVRAYHDARMAEVLAFQRHRQAGLAAVCPRPGQFQPDEKAQLNRLLGEWLSHCLEHGYVPEPVFMPGQGGTA